MDNSASDSVLEFPVPSFIRLFVINRVLTLVNERNDSGDSKIKTLKNMVLILQNEKFQESAMEILFRLQKDGIKEYMSQYYIEKEQSNIIELIFNKIILHKFEKQYQKIITYVSKNGDDNDINDHYQSVVFNMNDLMCLIFQFLQYESTFKGDLYSCSLVNSHWLYHCWNPNSVYFVNLSYLFKKTMEQIKSGTRNSCFRTWQRFCNVKSISLNSPAKQDDIDDDCKEELLERMSLMKHVENVCGWYSSSASCNILAHIIVKWQYKIKKYWTYYMSPAPLFKLQLLNARKITIHDHETLSCIIWSHKCEKLIIQWVREINENFMQCVINDCDCTGIKSLTIEDSMFDSLFTSTAPLNQENANENNSNDNLKLSPEKLLNKFAKKFINLQELYLYFEIQCDWQIVLLCKLLKPIIEKNHVKVHLEISAGLGNDEYKVLSEGIADMNGKISSMKLQVNKRAFNNFEFEVTKALPIDWIIRILSDCSKNLRWLEISQDDVGYKFDNVDISDISTSDENNNKLQISLSQFVPIVCYLSQANWWYGNDKYQRIYQNRSNTNKDNHDDDDKDNVIKVGEAVKETDGTPQQKKVDFVKLPLLEGIELRNSFVQRNLQEINSCLIKYVLNLEDKVKQKMFLTMSFVVDYRYQDDHSTDDDQDDSHDDDDSDDTDDDSHDNDDDNDDNDNDIDNDNDNDNGQMNNNTNLYAFDHETEFKQFCQSVVEIIKQRMAFDITVRFKGYIADEELEFNQCNDIFLSYFGGDLLANQYKPPQSKNQTWVGFQRLVASFTHKTVKETREHFVRCQIRNAEKN